MGHIATLRNQFKSKLWLYHNVDLERKKAIIFLKIEWSWFVKPGVPFTNDCFVPSLVEIGQVVLENIFKFRQCIFAISYLSPLGKGVALYLNKIESLFTQGCFAPCLVEISPVVLEKKMKMWKCEKFAEGRHAISDQKFQLRWAKQETHWPLQSTEYQRLYNDFLSEELIFTHQKLNHRINKNQHWQRKAAI